MSRTGRRTKLTDEIVDRLVEAARKGMTRDLQAAYAGVGKSTLYRWLSEGRQAKSKRSKVAVLVERMKAAEGAGAFDAIAKIAGSSDWRAAAWLLERRHGYRKNGPAESAREEALELAVDETRIERLERQIRDVRIANRRALQSGSFQAYFRGMSQEERLASDLEFARLEGEQDDGLDDMGSAQFLEEFTIRAADWPDQLLEAVIGVYERRKGVVLLGARGVA